MKEILTLRELKKMRACPEALEKFSCIFGAQAPIKRIIQRLHKDEKKDRSYYEMWEGWLLAQKPGLTYSMLINGANVHTLNDFALRHASSKNHAEVVRILVEHDANVHATDDYALQLASWNGHTEIVRYLLINGAHVHAQNNLALLWAADAGHIKTVKALLEYGADVHACNDRALYRAASNDHNRVVKILKKAIEKQGS